MLRRIGSKDDRTGARQERAGVAMPAGTLAVTHISLAKTKHRFVILGVSLVGAIVLAAGLLIDNMRAVALADRVSVNDNLAQVLAEQTSRTMQPVDLVLRELQGRLEAPDGANAGGRADWGSLAVFDLLVERRKELPQVDALIIIGVDGQLANFSRSFPPLPLDATQRDYYQYLSTHDDHSVFISAPAKSFLTGKWIVFIARRVNDSGSTFAGIVVAVVTLSYLEDFYRAVTVDDGAVTVLRRDGVILARHPFAESLIGTKIPENRPWYDLVRAGGGPFRANSLLDKAPRLVSVRPLRDFPLVIDTSTSETSAFSSGQNPVIWVLAGAALATAIVILLLRLFARQYSRLAGQNVQLEINRRLFDTVLDNMSQGLSFVDDNQKLLVCNRRYAEIYRLSAEQTNPGTPLWQLIDHRVANGSVPDMTAAEYLARRRDLAQDRKSFDLTDEFRDGRVVSMHFRPLPGGGWVTTHEDITERRRAEADLAFMARHDPLTTLPNRTLFQERLEQAIVLAEHGSTCALLCLDLDRFKVVNDTLGHPIGDSLLRAAAVRLSSVVTAADTVARLGGDEFAIIQMDLRSPTDAVSLAERIIASLREPYQIDGHRIVTGVSIGIAIVPLDGTSSDTLLRKADIALYVAKIEGRGTHRLFEPEIDSYVEKRRVMELDLRNARLTDFELHYQPILDLRSGSVIGFEALIRWNHPLRGLINPADFIPIAEETGLIIAIGEWALRTACVEAAGWPDDIEISVNLSPAQFKGTPLLTTVRNALATAGLAPSRLKLEITESVLMQNSTETLTLLHQLRAEGIRIALDDFGTGYSSLSYLRSFPFDRIKIDRSFVRYIDTNDGSCLIVGAIVALAQGLGMTTLAEGVETWEQLERVREQGCALVQGYLFSRPHPGSEVSALIRTLRVYPSRPHESDHRRNAPRVDDDKVLPVPIVPDDRGNGRFAEALIRGGG